MAIISNRNKISTAGYRPIREREFLNNAERLSADIKSLYDDYNALYRQDSERGGGIDVYRPDSSAWYDNVSGLDSSLQAKADDILKRVEYYKNYLDPEYYNTITKDIGNIKSNGSSILSNAQSMKDFYSGFTDEASYNEWLTQYKEHQALLGYDLTSAKNEIDTLKTQLDNITQGKPENFTTEAHELAKQYEEKVAYYGKAEQAQESLPFLTESKYEKFAEGVVPLYADLIADAASKGYINKGQNDFVKYQFLTPDEKRIYQGYWVNGEYKKANDYYNKILPDVEKRIASGFSQMSEIPGFRSIASVGTNMLAGVEGAGNMINYLSGQTNGLDKSVFAEGTSILRQGAAEDLGKFGGFVYNAAMSGVDSITANALLGPAGGAIMLGANAASSATNDALDRGMPEGKALQYGLVAGVFETLFENVSLGSLDKLKQSGIPTWKAYGKEVAKQIGVNASEETFTEIGTITYDSIVNGKYSTYAKLREEGKSPAEAIGSLGLDVLEAGASGALMGAGFGAVGGLKAKNNYNSFYDSVAGEIAGSGYTGDINLLVSALYKKQLADSGAGEIQSVNEREQSELDNYDKFVNNNRSRYELKGYLNTLKVGKNGMTEAASIDIGDRDTSEVAKAFAARYKQGVNGSSIGGFDTAKYAILSETEQKIAYNAGKMDAAQSLSKKTEGFRAEKQAKIDAENARIEAERQEAEAKKQKAIEAKEQATYKKMTPQMQENAEKYGLRKNGALAYAGDYTGDKSDASIGKYTVDFIKAYNAGKKGTDISRVPLGSLTDGQRRRAYNAGKADVEQNAPKFSSADIKTTSSTTASSTVKQGSTKILADNSKAVANEISKIESPKMRQYAKDFKLGENGVKTYATVYNKSQNEGVYTQDFVEVYNAGKSGKDISDVKASSLTEAQKKQAYNAGKMDAIKATVDDKKSRTKTFGGGEKVIVADESKLTVEQKNLRDNFAKAGIKVYYGDIFTSDGKAANGLYDHDTGNIYLSTNPKKAVEFVAKHELTHFIEKRVGQQQYFDMMNTIFDSDTFKKWYEGKGFKNLAGMTSNKISEYRSGGIKLDEMGAKKEILADFVGEMLFGGKNQISDNLFSELDDNHKKTFREWISALIDRLKTLFKGNKTAEDEITKLESKFKEMLRESVKSEAPGETNTVLSYTPDEGIDNSNENDYNIYTSSDEYIREVTPTDRRFFPRKLANKTAFLEDGDIETVHLYCPEKVYTFVANGYMKGYISKSEKVSKLEARKRRYEKYDGNRVNVHRTVIDVWSEPVPNQSRRPIDDVSDARGGRRPNADDILSKDTSGSARKGNYERVRENTYSQEEVNEIIRQLREMYGYANSESSLSYTPADEQELTRMAQNGEISAEEYGRRMLEMKESRHTKDPYEIARMNKEDLENPLPGLDRKNGEAKGDGQSKFYDSLQRSKLFDETFKKEVESDKFIEQYKTITNKETLAEAAKLLDGGGQDYVNTWFKKSPIRMTVVDSAVGFILLKRYQDIGNYTSAIAVAEKLREVGTRIGQNLQIYSILNRFTPEMMQIYAQKQLDEAFEEMVKGKAQKWIDKNKDKFKLTDEDIDFIRTRTLQAALLPNGSREQAIRLAEITARLQDKIPPSVSTSWKTWQRMSMLFNPKTHLRNVAGNGIIAPAFVASDWFGAPVDILLSKFTGKRTTGLTGVMGHNNKDLAEALKGASEAYDDFLRGINTKIEFDKFKIDSAGKGFNEHGKFGKMAKVLNNIDSFNSFLLTAEDALFYKMWFMNSLNNQKKLNNVSEATLEMIEIAQQEALQRTWQDNNVATKAVGAIKKVLNLDFTFKNEATGETYNPYQRIFHGYGFGDVFIKFVKTPANLTKAIYDFSPAGFASVAAKSAAFSRAVKKGTVSAKLQKDLVNSIGKAISGTLLYLIFGAMYSAGWITGKGDDDKDVAAFEKYVQGAPEYAIKIGKKWWSYDWAQPVGAIPAIISNGREAINEKDGAFQAVLEAISAGGDVLFDQSFMSSIQQMFSSTNFFGNLASAILNEITVPIPTLLSQTANAFDEKRRTTYDSQSSIRTAINKFKQKIPGLRNTLEVERDILGRETPNSQKNILNAFFNPMNTFTDTSTSVTDHVYELYQSTGEASAIPSKAPYDVTIKGVKHTFSIEERNEYQRIMGETSAQIIGELLNNESYMALSDEQKLAVIKSVYSYSQSLAKSEMGLAESYDVISGIKDITEDEYDAMSDAEIKAIADDYVLSSYYSISDFDNVKKATWFINKSLPSAINAAIKSGDMAKAQELINSIETNIKSFGLPKKETSEMIKKSQSSIKSEITSYWKEKFIEAHKRGDNGEKIRIKQILVDTGLYGNSADVRDLTNGWKKEK